MELLPGRKSRTKMLNTGHVVNRQTLDRQVRMADKRNLSAMLDQLTSQRVIKHC